MNKYTRGFTIIELLIVITIIGILAAIIIVLFSGAQQRANNSQTISIVTQYIKASTQYAIDNFKYPEPSAGTLDWSCLGNGYPGNTCLTKLGALPCNGFGTVVSQSWYNDAVKPYLRNKTPTTSLQNVPCSGTFSSGGAYLSNWPTVGQAAIFYQLNGNIGCGSPGGIKADVYFYADNNSPMCHVILPSA